MALSLPLVVGSREEGTGDRESTSQQPAASQQRPAAATQMAAVTVPVPVSVPASSSNASISRPAAPVLDGLNGQSAHQSEGLSHSGGIDNSTVNMAMTPAASNRNRRQLSIAVPGMMVNSMLAVIDDDRGEATATPRMDPVSETTSTSQNNDEQTMLRERQREAAMQSLEGRWPIDDGLDEIDSRVTAAGLDDRAMGSDAFCSSEKAHTASDQPFGPTSRASSNPDGGVQTSEESPTTGQDQQTVPLADFSPSVEVTSPRSPAYSTNGGTYETRASGAMIGSAGAQEQLSVSLLLFLFRLQQTHTLLRVSRAVFQSGFRHFRLPSRPDQTGAPFLPIS